VEVIEILEAIQTSAGRERPVELTSFFAPREAVDFA